MNVDSILRAQARELMDAGKLPHRLPDRMWGGRGVGAPCEVCGVPVKHDESELEIEWVDGCTFLEAAREHVRSGLCGR